MAQALTPYSAHPSFNREAAGAALLVERTGKSLGQWVDAVKATRLVGAPRVAWLKERGLTTNYATWVAATADGEGGADSYDPHALVAAHYAGKRAVLRPIYDALLALCLELGDEVRVCPAKTRVPVYRRHVIAETKATTIARVDLGLALGDRKTPARLVDTGGFAKKDRITRRIEIAAVGQIDATVRKWLAAAYAADGGAGE